MTEDRKLANRSPSASDRLASATASTDQAAATDSSAGRAGSSAPSSLEDALRALAAARSELTAVRSERDRLQRELSALGAMQTETIALGADEAKACLSETLPTLDELMAGLNTFQEAAADHHRADSAPDDDVMLAPELVFEPDDEADDPRTRPIVPLKPKPERGGSGVSGGSEQAAPARPAATPTPAHARRPVALVAPVAPVAPNASRAPAAPVEKSAPAAEADPAMGAASAVVVVAALHAAAAAPPPRRMKNSRLLVFVDAEPPIKYPLYKSVMTVGRSEDADIRVDGDFISRVHARITTADAGAVTVEDVASKNGIRVNGQEVKRHVLRHGDVLSLGKLHFTFIDTAAADDE